MRCTNCGSNSVGTAPSGDVYCTECNVVVDQFDYVNDVGFTNNVREVSFMKNRRGNYIMDSRQIRMNKAYQLIVQIASKLNLNQYIIDNAKRYYNLASNNKFIQGRKTKHVVAVILYTVCRREKTRHLLLDFSDVLQTNLYVLGSIYLKLIRLLNIKVPLIDPSLFVHRFCAKLEFKEKSIQVCNTALRILQSMKRDWMTIGRRPSGLCGASILIAARIHGFKRTTQQVIEIVNVCDDTIRRRLEEFMSTPIARLSLEEFEKVDLNDIRGACNPPAFTKNRIKEKKELKDNKLIEKLAAEVEKLDCLTELYNNYKGDKDDLPLIPAKYKDESFLSLKREGDPLLDREDLSDIDEKEADLYILSNEEYKLKKMLWEVVFDDWIQMDKLKRDKEDDKDKKPRRVVKRMPKSTQIANNPVEAIKMSKKFGTKLNIDKVSQLFGEEEAK